jgi:hypothetical protein
MMNGLPMDVSLNDGVTDECSLNGELLSKITIKFKQEFGSKSKWNSIQPT